MLERFSLAAASPAGTVSAIEPLDLRHSKFFVGLALVKRSVLLRPVEINGFDAAARMADNDFGQVLGK